MVLTAGPPKKRIHPRITPGMGVLRVRWMPRVHGSWIVRPPYPSRRSDHRRSAARPWPGLGPVEPGQRAAGLPGGFARDRDDRPGAAAAGAVGAASAFALARP